MDVLGWLFDSDPALRWQVLRDLNQADDREVADVRALTSTEGWCAELLSLQGENGTWDHGAYYPDWIDDAYFENSPGQPWTATAPTLLLLTQLGVDPLAPRVLDAVSRVSDGVRWEHDGQRFFDGEVEPCVNALTVAVGSYFGIEVDGVVDRLLDERLPDGGWNCEAEHGSTRSSFHTTIAVVEALLGYERATGGTDAVREARAAGEAYLLDRKLLRSRRTGQIIDESWTSFSFPVRWFYDVLRGLEHFRAADADPSDPRLAEALDLVRSKRQPDGTWLLENTHAGETQLHFDEGDGRPSRWNTLRALRVLRWAGDQVPAQ